MTSPLLVLMFLSSSQLMKVSVATADKVSERSPVLGNMLTTKTTNANVPLRRTTPPFTPRRGESTTAINVAARNGTNTFITAAIATPPANAEISGKNTIRTTPVVSTASTTTTIKPTGHGTTDSIAIECGVTDVVPKACPRIAGGVEAIPHSWPWQVNFLYSECSWCTWCGGSLINSEWILCAAHCFEAYVKTDFRVVLGDHLTGTNEGSEEEFTMRQVIAHEQYNPITHENDIALVRLSSPAKLTAYVRPVCLPTTNAQTGNVCIATGWGLTSGTGNGSLSLNQVCVPIINQTECNEWYNGRITANMFCAGFAEGGRDTCKGDSGGPLVCSSEHRWYLNGVTSWGESCAGSNRPGVYARVWNYLDWIRETLNRRSVTIQLRLAGPWNASNSTEGRLEVYYNGTWGTVCDDDFTDAAASVACASLGFGRSGIVLGNLYGPGSGTIWLDSVTCIGTEDSLDDCSHSNWGSSDCKHSEDVSIHCGDLMTSPAATIETNTVSQFSLRLVNPDSTSPWSNEGRLEVYFNGTWGTICDDYFTDAAASVACESLGFGRNGKFLNNYFGPGAGMIWLDDIICNGSERSLFDCQHGPWGITNNCGHYEDVSISCSIISTTYDPSTVDFSTKVNSGVCVFSDFRNRLIGPSEFPKEPPSEGLLEVSCPLGSGWGTVCDDHFTNVSAKVVCASLGFGNTGRVLDNELEDSERRSEGQTNLLGGVQCTGTEANIFDCSHGIWESSECDSNEGVSISCKSISPLQLRLVSDNSSSSSPREGRLEIYHNGSWGTVCNHRFSDFSAQVACAGLGFGFIGQFTGSLYPATSGPIWLDYVACTGNEQSLDNCSHSNWGRHNCSHDNDVSISCTYPVRLFDPLSTRTQPRAGRLEIFYLGSWGTVCDDGFTNANARVVCNDLGFSHEGVFLSNRFGPGTGGKIWLDEVSCVGSEFNIGLCSHGLWGTHDCSHAEDVSISCGVECGQPVSAPRPCPRIVGGVEAIPHSWPWQVSMLHSRCGWCNFCGASIIYSDWLVTAAHCLLRNSASDIRLVFGEHDLLKTEGTELEIGIRLMLPHHDYDESTNDNDIALIRLTKSVEYNDYIRPVCLPTRNAPSDAACMVTGWGQTYGTGNSMRLNQVCVPVLSQEQCNRSDWSEADWTPSANMFCAGYPGGGMDSCQGDSGGPLVCNTAGQWVLYGVTSWGEVCGEPNIPGVYTQVAKYVSWIKGMINLYGND